MEIMFIFVACLLVAVVASVLTRRGVRIVPDLVISAISTAITFALASVVQTAGTEWSFGISLFIAAALTLGLGALVRRPLARG